MTRNATDALRVKFNFQSCTAASVRCRGSVTAAASAVDQPFVTAQSQSAAANAVVTKPNVQRDDGEPAALRGADRRQVRSGQLRHGKPLLPPTKDRRRTPAAVQSPKKTSTTTSEKADCSGEWMPVAASVQMAGGRRHPHHQQQHQQQHKPQHHRKKTDSSSLYGGSFDHSTRTIVNIGSGAAGRETMTLQPPAHCGGLHPAATTTTAPPASAPFFTAVPAAAAGVLLHHAALPVGTRRRGPTCPAGAGVLQPVDASSLARRHGHGHQHVLVAEQPATPYSRLCRPSTAGPARGNAAAGWGYTAAQPTPAVCREYLLFGPSSVLLLR